MGAQRTCKVCRLAIEDVDRCESAVVRSNVRRFIDESFVVWRCPGCRSIHARDEVDLQHYYAHYPFHKMAPNPLLRFFHHKLLRRMRRAGLERHHHVIDYGCGSGLFVDYLKSKGFAHAVGYDAFSERFRDAGALERTYDCIFSQDVIEHVPEPWDLLHTFQRLAKPNGIIAIGTPNAAAIDLARPLDTLHALHQPYHRSILAKDALIAAGDELGWRLLRYYPAAYGNTYLPFVNFRMWTRYSGALDNTMDLVFESPHFRLRFLSPAALFDAFLGGFFCPDLDVMAVFRADTPQTGTRNKE